MPNDTDINEQKYQKKTRGFRWAAPLSVDLFRLTRLPRAAKRVIIVVGVLTLFYFVLMLTARSSAQNDRLFDPHANPNIRVESNHL